MDNARSYGSRFSGLGLFILALLVVGILVVLTIRSAQEDPGTEVSTPQTSETADDATVTDGSSATAASDDTDTGAVAANDNPATTGSAGQTPAASADSDDAAEDDQVAAGVVAADTTNLPNTGSEEAVITVLGLAVLTASISSYRKSRRLILTTQRHY